MSQRPFDRWVDSYLSRVRCGEFLRKAAECLAGFLFLFGGAVLIVKLFQPAWWPHVLWIAAGSVGALGLAGVLARRNRWSRQESIASLDRSLGAGGLLMTLAELPDAEWQTRLSEFEPVWQQALPRLRPRRFASYLVLPLTFAIGACFIPLREARTAPVTRNTVGQKAVQGLEELLAELKKEAVFEKEEEAQLKNEIDKLREEAQKTPLTHEKWETLDALQERMRMRLEGSTATVSQMQDVISTLLDSLKGDGPELNLDRAESLEKELLESLQKLAAKGQFSKASPELLDQLQRLTKKKPDGSLESRLPTDPQERQEFLDELQKFLDGEEEKLAELREKCAGGKCKKGGEGEGEEGFEIDENGNLVPCGQGGKCKGGKSAGQLAGNLPGRGGITRGRGDADLTFGPESDRSGIKLKDLKLPDGFQEQPKDQVVGVERVAPLVDPVADVQRSGQRTQDPATGSTSWSRRISPRHRNVVKQFFDEK